MRIFKTIVFLPWILLAGILKPDPISLNTQREGDKVHFIAENPNFFPVTVELDLKVQNIITKDAFPIIRVLPPNSTQSLTEVTINDASKAWNYETSYIFYTGDINAKHNNRFAYRLPYAVNSSERVGQAYGGAFSHTGANFNSIDFNMEEGSKVIAARSGVVIEVVEQFDKGGGDRSYIKQANYITIMHDDGTLADYSHLRKNGSVVREGQQVRMGQHIGYSGSTGYATGPHLHFVVKKAKRGGGYDSIPVKFKTHEGILILQQGESYTAY